MKNILRFIIRFPFLIPFTILAIIEWSFGDEKSLGFCAKLWKGEIR